MGCHFQINYKVLPLMPPLLSLPPPSFFLAVCLSVPPLVRPVRQELGEALGKGSKERTPSVQNGVLLTAR